MAPSATQELLLHLPADVVDLVKRAAQERLETPDTVVAEALRFSLQPLRQEALRRLGSQVRRQQTQSETALRAHLGARLTPQEEQRLSQLLEVSRSEGLTAGQQSELQALFDRIEAVATEKAAALWLLSARRADPAPEP